MKESYDEGVANHIDPESCGGGSNAMAEALTGVRAGRVLGRKWDVRAEIAQLFDFTPLFQHVIILDMYLQRMESLTEIT
jgi:hypothetical protein